MPDVQHLEPIHRLFLCLSARTIHHADHLRPEDEEDAKVGGHQASSASMAAVLTALHFHALRPEDRVAAKPHAGPVFHALQHLMGCRIRSKLEGFRAWGGAQS